ncbi:MAG TPA: ribonuclease T2 [Acidobacteriaceae bacterium]|nr:ribonuclease T2 [Acidobacteriaceae bacterium]
MKKILLTVVLLCLTACNSPAPVNTTPAATRHSNPTIAALPQPTGPQRFDYYLLNLSWSPEFCHSHQSAPECGHGATFVLHGLWPQNSDGTYPQNCSNAPGPAEPSQYSDIYPDPGLLEHEWSTHGTCSGLSPDAFFTTARAAFEAFAVPPKLAQLSGQISLAPNQILSLVTQSNPKIGANSLALSCGNNYLTAVEVCLDKQLHPVACGPVRSCRAQTVRIPPP